MATASLAFPGAEAALERLRDAGATLGIVTAGHREVVEPQLERTGLGRLLPVRVFGDDLPVHKPDPEPLRRALRLAGHGHRPERSIYVGDAPTDMQMAVAVGARAIGIESVLGDPDELRAAGAARGGAVGRGLGGGASRRGARPARAALERAPSPDEPSPRPRPRGRHGRAGGRPRLRPGRAGRTGSTS